MPVVPTVASSRASITKATFANIMRLKATCAVSNSGPTGLRLNCLHIAMIDIRWLLLDLEEGGWRHATDAPRGIQPGEQPR